MKKFVNLFKDKKIIVFGTGASANDFIDQYWLNDIAYFVDNNSLKYGHYFNDKKIHAPEDLLKEIKNGIIIIIASMYYDEISSQLDRMGFIENKNYIDVKSVIFYLNGMQEHASGHYYSVVPDHQEAVLESKRILAPTSIKSSIIQDIDLNTNEQIDLLNILAEQYYVPELFGLKGEKTNRYYFQNDAFEYCDATLLNCMLRYVKPENVIEIGSGFSSAAMLDTNDKYFNQNINFTFIEPHPERLYSLLNEEDKSNSLIIETILQKVDVSVFKELKPNDILFVDSTHVSKIGSDVNYIIFEILPILNKGVFVHFHDMFYPFTYPVQWIQKGVYWNEAYILRAFLQNNKDYSIKLWGNYLNQYFEYIANESNLLFEKMPLCKKNVGGSLWLQKI